MFIPYLHCGNKLVAYKHCLSTSEHMKNFILTLIAACLFMSCGQTKKSTEQQENSKLIALSFDDGPNTTTTVKMLDMLEKHGVVGSFFVIGNNINDSSAVVMKRAYDMGCDMGKVRREVFKRQKA